jgi:Flp pilus assembly protein TadG
MNVSRSRFRGAQGTARERGAVLVESAFVLLLILTIVFGIIEWGLYFKDTLSVSSATRSGVRTASALPRTDFYQQTADAVGTSLNALEGDSPQALWIYKAGSNGLPDSGNFSSCAVCVKYTWNTSTRAWQSPTGTWTPASQTACGGASSDAVGVYVKATHKFVTGFFGSTRTMEDHTVMKFEPVRGQCAP